MLRYEQVRCGVEDSRSFSFLRGKRRDEGNDVQRVNAIITVFRLERDSSISTSYLGLNPTLYIQITGKLLQSCRIMGRPIKSNCGSLSSYDRIDIW